MRRRVLRVPSDASCAYPFIGCMELHEGSPAGRGVVRNTRMGGRLRRTGGDRRRTADSRRESVDCWVDRAESGFGPCVRRSIAVSLRRRSGFDPDRRGPDGRALGLVPARDRGVVFRERREEGRQLGVWYSSRSVPSGRATCVQDARCSLIPVRGRIARLGDRRRNSGRLGSRRPGVECAP